MIPQIDKPHETSRHPRREAKPYAVREVSDRQWERLLESFPGHSVFHTLAWLQTIEKVHRARVRLLQAVDASPGGGDNSETCMAIWPVFTTRKGPLKILGSPVPGWCTAYLGPIFANGCNVDRALRAFMHHKVLRSGSYFSCKVLVDEQEIDLRPYGFVEVERLDTYCVDLSQDREALWSNLKSECRTQIRKARKMNLEVRRESDDSFLDQYWEMSCETFAICKIAPPFTREFLGQMWRHLEPRGRVIALSAFHEGERIATLMLPFDGQTMYYWGGASHIRCRGIPAHNLLHWEALKLGQDLGLKRYDFVSTLGNGGRFKKTFGPQAVHMATHWERTTSRAVRLLRHGYERYLAARQRLARWELGVSKVFSRLFTVGLMLSPVGA